MNALERRRIVKGQVVDVAIAKVAINKSRRERADAVKKLRKEIAASRFISAIRSESVSLPRQAAV